MRAAFERWREDGLRETREHAKPVRDALLRRTFEVAAAADRRPIHIHCGGGDPAIVSATRGPQDSFPLLSEHIDQPVVLIHAGQPWLEEGAYVASILPHVYLDMSITMPVGVACDRRQARGAARHRARPRRCSTARTRRASPRCCGCRRWWGARRSSACWGPPSSGAGSTRRRRERSARACSRATPPAARHLSVSGRVRGAPQQGGGVARRTARGAARCRAGGLHGLGLRRAGRARGSSKMGGLARAPTEPEPRANLRGTVLAVRPESWGRGPPSSQQKGRPWW